jgi:hypothetical protein
VLKALDHQPREGIHDPSTLEPYVLTGDAYAGLGQISALATDGITYAIPLDNVAWLDSKGTTHGNGRAECLPPDLKTGKVKFAAVRWTAAGVGGYSVVLVDCRS